MSEEDKKILLRVCHLKQYYPIKRRAKSTRNQYVKANDDISFEIYEGETLGLVGESGCGKSSLGRGILQLNPVTDGAILYYGISMEECLPRYRYKMYQGLKKRLQTGVSVKELQTDETAKECLGGLLCSMHLQYVLDLFLQLYRTSSQRKREEIKKLVEKEKDSCKRNEQFQTFEASYECGIDLRRLTKKELRDLRKELQLIFQDPYSSLNPRMTAEQIIGEGVFIHGLVNNRGQLKKYVTDIMEQCGLNSSMLNRYPHQFSGGQRQRIGIARSLALQPKFVICDEAVSALDVSIQAQIINLLIERKKNSNLTYLFISHDLSVIRYMSDRILVMYLGKMVELADCEDIFEHAIHPYTVALLSAIPDVSGRKMGEVKLTGEIPSLIDPPRGCPFHTRCPYTTSICEREVPNFEEKKQGHYVACHHAERRL